MSPVLADTSLWWSHFVRPKPADPIFVIAPHADIVRFIQRYRPAGIGWVDVNLLLSCLECGALLWTNAKALRAAAAQHGRAMRLPD